MRFWNTFYTVKDSGNTSVLSSVSSKYDDALNFIKSIDNYFLFSDLFYNVNYYAYCLTSKLTSLLNQALSVTSFSIESHSYDSLIMSLKFLSLIALLIFIRGGIPRYRFDHLTKIGWIKFLSLVVASILVELLLVYFM